MTALMTSRSAGSLAQEISLRSLRLCGAFLRVYIHHRGAEDTEGDRGTRGQRDSGTRDREKVTK